MSRDERTTPPRSNTTWLARTPIVSSPSSPAWAMRTSSCSARAGTFASKEPSSGASSPVSFTERR